MNPGDKITVIENTHNGLRFEWEGTVVKVESWGFQTKHCRCRTRHPEWAEYRRAYEDTWTNHWNTQNVFLTTHKEAKQ